MNEKNKKPSKRAIEKINKMTLGSAHNSDLSVTARLGEDARNLVGRFVKHDPISGNQINASFSF